MHIGLLSLGLGLVLVLELLLGSGLGLGLETGFRVGNGAHGSQTPI